MTFADIWRYILAFASTILVAANASMDTNATATTVTPAVDGAAPSWPAFTWLSQIGDAFYINLPAVDNWSSYGKLRTTWSKLRLVRAPEIGDKSVMINFTDTAFTASHGHPPPGRTLMHVPWGVAAECKGEQKSDLRINLVGTPFAYEAKFMIAGGFEAHGGVICSDDRQNCSGSCGGWCGYCGIGEPTATHNATLAIIHQRHFDAIILAFLHPQYFDEMLNGFKNWKPGAVVTPKAELVETTQPPSEEGRSGNPAFTVIFVLLVIAIMVVVAVLIIRKCCPRCFDKMQHATSLAQNRDDPSNDFPVMRFGHSVGDSGSLKGEAI